MLMSVDDWVHAEAGAFGEMLQGRQGGHHSPTLALELREVYVRYQEGGC